MQYCKLFQQLTYFESLKRRSNWDVSQCKILRRVCRSVILCQGTRYFFHAHASFVSCCTSHNSATGYPRVGIPGFRSFSVFAERPLFDPCLEPSSLESNPFLPPYRIRFSAEATMGLYIFATPSRTSPGPTEPPIRWVSGFFPWRYSGRNVNLTPPSVAEVKNTLRYTSTPPHVLMA